MAVSETDPRARRSCLKRRFGRGRSNIDTHNALEPRPPRYLKQIAFAIYNFMT